MMLVHLLWCGECTQKWQYRSYADDLGEGCYDHEGKEQVKLLLTAAR